MAFSSRQYILLLVDDHLGNGVIAGGWWACIGIRMRIRKRRRRRRRTRL